MRSIVIGFVLAWTLCAAHAQKPQGYYRFPTLHKDSIVFTSEGDLWKVGVKGGVAQRLTSHAGQETRAVFSPDGSMIGFSAQYEGPTEIYTMPATGGLPSRRTYDGGNAVMIGWTHDGKILYSTRRYAGLPDRQLVTVELGTGVSKVIELSQAADGAFDNDGKTLFFTRLPFQGSSTKRYMGGTAQKLWKFSDGAEEAVPLTSDYHGSSKEPMFWRGRVYFLSDRDGTMNIWSMNPDGQSLQQETKHKGWDIKSAKLSEGRIVYQQGADVRLLNLATKADAAVPIELASDFDQERERWIKNPAEYVTSWSISPNGDRIVLTARGQVFVAPVKTGRFVEATRQKQGVRWRNATFMPDGKSLLALSDQTGELEFYKIPANGVGEPEQLTTDGRVLRFAGTPSPDGKFIAFADQDFQLWIFDVEKKESKLVSVSNTGEFGGINWSSDSQWLSYTRQADNDFPQLWIYNVPNASITPVTTERTDSYDIAWAPGGKWLYFLSDRDIKSLVGSPWGQRHPEPFYDKTTQLFALALQKGQRSPFLPKHELITDTKDSKKDAPGASVPLPDEKKPDTEKPEEKKTEEPKEKLEEKKPEKKTIDIELEGLRERLVKVPAPSGNYRGLSATDKYLFYLSRPTAESRWNLMRLEIKAEDAKPKEFVQDVSGYELTADLKKIAFRKGDRYYVTSVDGDAKLDEQAELGNWRFTINPREEWRQMFTESWRLMRDYFYDRKMHGVDWPAMLAKYKPLVDRVSDRAELSDLMAEMVGELSALHTVVRGGDLRSSPDNIQTASLGAQFEVDPAAGGYRVTHIFQNDPEYPDDTAPLARPDVDVKVGEVITMVNGIDVMSAPTLAALLRDQVGKQMLLRVKSAAGETREVIVTPISVGTEDDLRYSEWEYTRRKTVEDQSVGEIGYIHLRAMGTGDMATWAREYYPIFNRKGLIIDVRHNRGGNIDSWILSRLLRKAWFFWQGRTGNPYWNMQHAFRGHIVVLCNEFTASDGEAFSEGFKRLGLGKVIGTRTWGGEIWLRGNNWLVDKGIATAAEFGVYGPEGAWLIEGHGVEPDMVVDNLPHQTFKGRDAQLEAAIAYLKKEIADKPVTVPPAPPHPIKAFKEIN